MTPAAHGGSSRRYALGVAAVEAIDIVLGDNLRSDTLVSHVGELLARSESAPDAHASQGLQLAALVSFWYVPLTHGSHCFAVVFTNFPGTHSLHTP